MSDLRRTVFKSSVSDDGLSDVDRGSIGGFDVKFFDDLSCLREFIVGGIEFEEVVIVHSGLAQFEGILGG